MEQIRIYLLGVVAAAIICGIVTRLLGEKGTQGAMAKLIAGLFLAFTVLRPVANIHLDDLADHSSVYSEAGERAALEGKLISKEILAASIKGKTEAYILDKAAALNLKLEVDVTMSSDDFPVPMKVLLSGKASPYAKAQLQTVIARDLGINKENQIWT